MSSPQAPRTPPGPTADAVAHWFGRPSLPSGQPQAPQWLGNISLGNMMTERDRERLREGERGRERERETKEKRERVICPQQIILGARMLDNLFPPYQEKHDLYPSEDQRDGSSAAGRS